MSIHMSDIKVYKDLYTAITENYSSKQGGQGTTFRVKRNLEGEASSYIIKILKQQKDLERRGRMRREFTSLETIKIKGIPSAIDSNTEFFRNLEYKLFIVMEDIPGLTLAEYVNLLEAESLNVDFLQIVEFFNNFLDILKKCHEQNIIHRDLKPDNIILKDNNILEPYLVDFGQSFNEIEEEGTLETLDFQILGNRFLFLPELAKNSPNKKDHRSDITMAVAVLFYVLTGKEVGHLIDQENKLPHQREIYSRFLCQVDPEINNKLKRVFDKGFQQNINVRYQSIDALKEDFSNAINIVNVKQNLKDKVDQFNKDRQNETAKAILSLNEKLHELFSFSNAVSYNIANFEFNKTLTKVAGKLIKNLPESIGGATFAFIDKTDLEKKVSLKIVGQIIGNEIVFIGEVIDSTLDDNIVLLRGDTICRINLEDDFFAAYPHVENYVIEQIIKMLK